MLLTFVISSILSEAVCKCRSGLAAGEKLLCGLCFMQQVLESSEVPIFLFEKEIAICYSFKIDYLQILLMQSSENIFLYIH